MDSDTYIVIPRSSAIELQEDWFELSLTLQYLIDFNTTEGAR